MTALVVTLGVVSTTGTAHADTVLKLDYPVSGVTHLNANDTDMPLGPGTLSVSIDEAGGLTGTTALPSATVSFMRFGFIPVTATIEFVEAAPTTGTVDLATGATQITSHLTFRMTSLSVFGIPRLLGVRCQTSAPVDITLNSTEGFSVMGGGDLKGFYTIPLYTTCFGSSDLINPIFSGGGNVITLTLGPAVVSPSSPTADPRTVFRPRALR